MPEFGDLVGTVGPVGAVLAWMWMADRKKDAPKSDPAAELLKEMRTISDKLIRIEAILEAQEK